MAYPSKLALICQSGTDLGGEVWRVFPFAAWAGFPGSANLLPPKRERENLRGLTKTHCNFLCVKERILCQLSAYG